MRYVDAVDCAHASWDSRQRAGARRHYVGALVRQGRLQSHVETRVAKQGLDGHSAFPYYVVVPGRRPAVGLRLELRHALDAPFHVHHAFGWSARCTEAVSRGPLYAATPEAPALIARE